MGFFSRWIVRLAMGIVLIAVGAAGAFWLMQRAPSLLPSWPSWTETQVEDAIVATLQREAPAAFLVTGTLDINVDITRSNTKEIILEAFDTAISLGTTRSTVRLPGVVSYGVDLHTLSRETIEIGPDSTIVITIPGVSVQAVEPNLAGMLVQTEVGWARMSARSGRTVERQAIVAAQEALREEAHAHLQRSAQPVRNTEAALQLLLAPVLQQLGIVNPQIRVRIAPTLAADPG